MASPIRVAGCTTITASYLAFARVLAKSWRRYHPDAPFYVLVIDVMEPDTLQEEFTVVLPVDLNLDPVEIRIRAGIYTPHEFAISLKPLLLRFVLERGADTAVYIDPDSELFASIADVGSSAAAHGIALTPHFLHPVPLDSFVPREVGQVRYGVYNSGLIAVAPSAIPFLSWWAARISRDCLMDDVAGLHGDQPWLDFVPAYFPYVMVDDPTIHVAWWNLHERRLDVTNDCFSVDGAPLRHFHFSGFDPNRPGTVSRSIEGWAGLGPAPFVGSLRPGVLENPAVARLHEEYLAKILLAGHRETSTRPYGFGSTAQGTTLGTPERRAYRAAVIKAEANGATLPPDRFDPAQERDFKRLVKHARPRRVTAVRLLPWRLRQLLTPFVGERRLTPRVGPSLRRLTRRQPLSAQESDPEVEVEGDRE